MKKNLDYRIANPGISLMLLLCAFVFCLVMVGILVPVLGKIIQRPEAAGRILAVVQDLFIFIIPAFVAAFTATRLPARMLGVDQPPKASLFLLALLVLFVSVPAMNMIISFNQNIHLPESMTSVEAWMRHTEDAASQATAAILSGDSVGTLIVSVLIVGVLAGFSEEIFFRGALQRILMATRLPAWSVIWIVAVIFSAFHFQFFGFIPRMLLGAYFGYLLYWTRCLWIPVCVHIINNSVYVISQWNSTDSADNAAINTFGSDLSSPAEILAVCVSVVLTVAGIWWLKSLAAKEEHLAAIGK